MKIFLARPRGFCAGVNRAIAIVNKALERHGAPVFVLHEIVHNSHVIDELRTKGAVFVERLEDIPQGAVAIFSAHGVSPAVEEKAVKLGLRSIDATCPLVATVHRRVSRLNKIGYDVLVIGHKGHPEVEGTCGHATGNVHVVSTVEEVAEVVVADESMVGYVTQTTLSVDDTKDIFEAIHKRFPLSSAPERSDICYATTNRQHAVRKLAEKVDVVLVVGSKNSSNSNRLREVAQLQGTPAYLIDHAGEIASEWLAGVERVGITAGASAPEHLVTEVIQHLAGEEDVPVTELEGEEENIRFQIPDLDV
ncbi:4-hydroxy-3-methylbut-2-enyl diphosphate reductase [Desulfogranum marinum]|uniref:4-hydroxy-3-methylbut-2-enyl diphosphate reductase n=1 Tax=Desulfogranum marinum TaxID=453220 RepID=UPI001963D9C8|nr:4-hydroxy-3-methylbut-2-enyl diphosphate reductase [Desulfogranum marinum]MBM9514098.1 4-hydroxy-3-methylbut-2-enyl diphosphate reductase [Desulfogranum marinum]